MGLWDEDDYGPIADRACWALFAVTTFIVLLRLLCRTILARGSTGKLGNLGSDDHITIFCILVLLLSCILISIGTTHGLGRHMHTLTPSQQVLALKWNVISSACLIWTFSLPKFAIVAILHRLLTPGLKTSILFWTLALSSQACILATSIWWFTQCTPVAYGWDRGIAGGGTCAPISVLKNLGYFTSAYSAFLDIFFALYPIPCIMRLNMPLRSRVAVSVALGLSTLACVVSVYKLAVFGEIFGILEDGDLTYPVPYLNILGIAEGAILIICASLPTLGPLVRLAKEKCGATVEPSNGYRMSSSNLERNGNTNTTGDGDGKSDNESWNDYKGMRLENRERERDLEDGCEISTDGREVGRERSLQCGSVDDIPLVVSENKGR